MLAFLGRFLLTVCYSGAGLWLAFPISYFFQDSLYDQITWGQYVAGGISSLIIGASFGALTVYRWTAIVCIILALIIGKQVETYFRRARL